MIAVPWFKFPWSTATADLAHALAQAAIDGNTEAKGQLEEIKQHADAGNTHAREAWRYFSAIIRLVVAGEPPPSVILQMRRTAVVGMNGGFPGAVPMLPWGYQSIWNYGFDPFVFEEMQADAELGQLPAGFTPMYNPPSWPSAVGEPLPGEVEYEYEVGQFPMGAPGGVPLLPFGFGPFNYGGGGDGYFRSGPGMSEDIELEDRYI
jgi:hypothetical protein